MRTGTTISGNTAQYGAGIHARAGNDLEVTNSLFSENVASQWGGGIYVNGAGAITNVDVINSTIAGNEAVIGGGIYRNTDSPFFIANSIVAENSSADMRDRYLMLSA